MLLGRELEGDPDREPGEPEAVLPGQVPALSAGILDLGEDSAHALAAKELEPRALGPLLRHASELEDERPGEVSALEGPGDPGQLKERPRDAEALKGLCAAEAEGGI